jgi:hypothetical protein
MSQLGQNRKSSIRAYDFRLTPVNGHRQRGRSDEAGHVSDFQTGRRRFFRSCRRPRSLYQISRTEKLDRLEKRRVEADERRDDIPAHKKPALVVDTQRLHFVEHLHCGTVGRLDALHRFDRENAMDPVVHGLEKTQAQIGRHLGQ